MDAMFWSCHNLTSVDLLSFNTENAKDICWLFNSCYKIKYINLSSFNTKNVFRVNSIFSSCGELKEIKLTRNTYEKLKKEIDEKQIKVIFV